MTATSDDLKSSPLISFFGFGKTRLTYIDHSRSKCFSKREFSNPNFREWNLQTGNWNRQSFWLLVFKTRKGCINIGFSKTKQKTIRIIYIPLTRSFTGKLNICTEKIHSLLYSIHWQLHCQCLSHHVQIWECHQEVQKMKSHPM